MSDPNAQKPDEPQKPKHEAWIENLAQRSTGLPSDEPKAKPDPGDKHLWRLAGLGLQFAGTVALMTWIGYAIDKKMGWSNRALIVMVLLGIVGNLYLLIKEAIRLNK